MLCYIKGGAFEYITSQMFFKCCHKTSENNYHNCTEMKSFAIVRLSGPEVIKLFSCSSQLSMKFFLLINVKMPTIVGILAFMSGKKSILGLSEPNISQIS